MTAAVTTLPAQDRSPTAARRLVNEALTEAGLEVMLDDALLLVTELVTNAVIHAGTDVELSIDIGPGRARIEVLDHGPGTVPSPDRNPADPSREGGRGMFLLDALAREWGTRHFAGGKSVWFELGVNDRVIPRPLPLRPPSKPRAAPAVSWLLGLPADLEERLSSTQLLTELMHRLCDAMGLEEGWLLAESAGDPSDWDLVAAHDVGLVGPDPDEVRRLARAGADAEMPNAAGRLVLPLRRRTGVFGALVVGDASSMDESGVALTRLVGDRMGVVLRDDRAHAAQLRDRGSLALLAEASELFAGTLDVTLAGTLAAQLVVPRFATWSAVYLQEEHGPRLAAGTHRDETASSELREVLVRRETCDVVDALMATLGDQPVLVPLRDVSAELVSGVGEILAVPLVARRRLLGLLLVGRTTGTGYARDDTGLLLDLARRAALAVDNARLYEERTAIAQALQSSLLPPALPTAAHVEFGARYAAAGEGNEVGGDFYDVFEIPDGRWAVAIGDVCGKGPEAAAITGLARNVMRLLTREGTPPPAVLRRLNNAILDLGDRGRFCTAILATVEPTSSGLLVCLSAAGHPPPVLVTADGRASLVGTSGSLLGVFEDVQIAGDDIAMRPGDSLVFYTDGVTERRSGDRMFAEESLLALCTAAAGSSADSFAGQLEQSVRDFSTEQSRDDLAVLVVRASG